MQDSKITLELECPENGAVGRVLHDGEREIPLVFSRRKGVIHGFINRCPHAGARLDWQRGGFLDPSGRWLECALHGARFEPDTGLCVAGPCRGARLRRVTVHQESEGRLVVECPPRATPALPPGSRP